MKEPNVHKELSEKLSKLFDLYPIDFTVAARKADMEMREGLAQAFANRGFRKLLENSIAQANAGLVRSSTQEHMIYYKARLDALVQLAAAGKAFFVDSEIMRHRTEKERLAKVEGETKDVPANKE